MSMDFSSPPSPPSPTISPSKFFEYFRIFLILDDEATQHEDGERKVVTVFKKIGEEFDLRGSTQQPPSKMEAQVNTRPSLTVKVAEEKILRLAHHTEF